MAVQSVAGPGTTPAPVNRPHGQTKTPAVKQLAPVPKKQPPAANQVKLTNTAAVGQQNIGARIDIKG